MPYLKTVIRSSSFIRNTLLLITLGLVSACTPKPQDPITLAINPWPGYDFLYLAEQQGFFKEVGLDIKLIQMDSLGDAQRAYTNGRVDGLSSTLIEAVQAEYLGGAPLAVVLVADYSNGGDVIVAPKSISDITKLKGQAVGAEVSSLGLFVLQRALAKSGMTLDDVEILNTEQTQGADYLANDRIEAFVTYPPASVALLRDDQYHTIFDSSEIPFEIVDTLSISRAVLHANPALPAKVMRAWQMALDFTESNPEQAYKIMADREGISTEEFQAVLADLVILDQKDQEKIFSNPEKIEASAKAVCEALVHAKAISAQCEKQRPIVWKGPL